MNKKTYHLLKFSLRLFVLLLHSTRASLNEFDEACKYFHMI